ncbi:MAG: acylneuraminate cytidylyltransferase family protein [Bacteroidia bacterium]|nr:acylneuraminate cytidylyltransferase family protein [Bacteroidia bacterium]
MKFSIFASNMIDKKSILALIPARGGSKGLPGKNIKPLLGKPLIEWTIEQAKHSKYIDDFFVSTDCSDIAKVSIQAGINVPFLRPENLSSDNTSSMDVVSSVINYYETNKIYFDYIILLEPTSPLRKENDIDSAIELAIQNQSADGIVSLGEVHMEHPMIVKKVGDNNRILSYINDVKKITQRQQADKAFFPYGVIYMIKTSVFKEKHAFYTDNIIPYFIERWQCYEVDDIYDFICIESILKYLKKDTK